MEFPQDGLLDLSRREDYAGLDAEMTEILGAAVSRAHFKDVGARHAYWCVACLVAISLTNSMQRSCINFMYTYNTEDAAKLQDPDFNIRVAVGGFDNDAYALLVGDSMSFISALFVLFTGGLSDFIDRKLLLCVSCFFWTLCTYLSSFATEFHQLLALKIIGTFFSAFTGPCSYSLLTDWIVPEERTMAYALYALGVQFGQPIQVYNVDMIDILGWKATF